MGQNSKAIELYNHQREAIEKLRTGSILHGGVGSGKSLTAVAYFYTKECGGEFESLQEIGQMESPKDLYIITTARKRDSLDWERECALFALSRDRSSSVQGVKVTVDSWNKIKHYVNVENAFFIFDEQRVVGSGAWVRSFLKITKKNNWILLSATPGDNWMDYVPVFIANGYYKNKTEFVRRHVVFVPYIRFPKIAKYINTGRLEKLRRSVLVRMKYVRNIEYVRTEVIVDHDKEKEDLIVRRRWNPYKDRPIKDASELFYALRKAVNSSPTRFEEIQKLIDKHQRLIIFYNFNYELEILRKLSSLPNIEVAEYNGHKHQDVPMSERWAYLVQYMSGGEAWNCISTNAVAFYSQNYSYRMMTQAAGRIDRMNTPFTSLHYYTLVSRSRIDKAIKKALGNKKDFNESDFKFVATETKHIIEEE